MIEKYVHICEGMQKANEKDCNDYVWAIYDDGEGWHIVGEHKRTTEVVMFQVQYCRFCGQYLCDRNNVKDKRKESMSNPFDQETLMAKCADAIVVKNEMKARVNETGRQVADMCLHSRFPTAKDREIAIQPLIAKEAEWMKLLKQATAVVDTRMAELLVPLEVKANGFERRRLRKEQ